jgi:drug/metabolite transporter (DMT)-like permease
VFLYEGYRTTPLGVIGPSSSVLVAMVPMVYGLIRRESLSGVQWTGVVVGTLAIGLVTYQRSNGTSDRGRSNVGRGLLLGFISGTLFGCGFLLMSFASDASGLSPVMMQRTGAFLTVAALTPFDKSPFLISATPARWFAMAAGVAASIGIGSLQLGFSRGSTTPVAVAASQSATVTVLLFVVFNRERFRWWQSLGIACSGIGVALLAL